MSIDCLFFLIFVPLYFFTVKPPKAKPSSPKTKNSSGIIRILYCPPGSFQWAMSFLMKRGFNKIGDLDLEHGLSSKKTIREKITPEVIFSLKAQQEADPAITVKKIIVLIKHKEKKTFSAAIMGKFEPIKFF